jgi:LPPG:FO 2-phospho-L-lactate transferase
VSEEDAAEVRLPRAQVRGRPLLMSDPGAAADLAGAALDLAIELKGARAWTR